MYRMAQIKPEGLDGDWFIRYGRACWCFGCSWGGYTVTDSAGTLTGDSDEFTLTGKQPKCFWFLPCCCCMIPCWTKQPTVCIVDQNSCRQIEIAFSFASQLLLMYVCVYVWFLINALAMIIGRVCSPATQGPFTFKRGEYKKTVEDGEDTFNVT